MWKIQFTKIDEAVPLSVVLSVLRREYTPPPLGIHVFVFPGPGDGIHEIHSVFWGTASFPAITPSYCVEGVSGIFSAVPMPEWVLASGPTFRKSIPVL